jgi:hypothetical protein
MSFVRAIATSMDPYLELSREAINDNSPAVFLTLTSLLKSIIFNDRSHLPFYGL